MHVRPVSMDRVRLVLYRPLNWNVPEAEALDAFKATIFWDGFADRIPGWIVYARLDAEDLAELNLDGTDAFLFVDEEDGFAFVVSQHPLEWKAEDARAQDEEYDEDLDDYDDEDDEDYDYEDYDYYDEGYFDYDDDEDYADDEDEEYEEYYEDMLLDFYRTLRDEEE